MVVYGGRHRREGHRDRGHGPAGLLPTGLALITGDWRGGLNVDPPLFSNNVRSLRGCQPPIALKYLRQSSHPARKTKSWNMG